MTTHTTQETRATMIPAPVRKVLNTLNMRPGYAQDARVAGGAVRDILLGIEPKDWDVATILLPPVVMHAAQTMGWDCIATGLQHGTVTLIVDGMNIEVTTLRIDTETDGRHAEVEFTTKWEEDAARRDLTINAMFMDVDGEITDFFDGQADLDENRVRFVGDAEARIQEDFLRILRFFRFAGRMGRGGDDTTLEVIQENVSGLDQISGERIWMEMQKILTGQILGILLNDMRDTKVLETIGVLDVRQREMQLAMLANMGNARPITVLAGLVNGRMELVDSLNERWKFSKSEFRALEDISILLRKKSDRLNDLNLGWFKRQIVKEHAVRGHVEEFALFTGRIGMVEEELRPWVAPEFPVKGHHLLDVGMTPGPAVGDTLRKLRVLWERGGCRASREDLLTKV